jgi:hypothetical protein
MTKHDKWRSAPLSPARIRQALGQQVGDRSAETNNAESVF